MTVTFQGIYTNDGRACSGAVTVHGPSGRVVSATLDGAGRYRVELTGRDLPGHRDPVAFEVVEVIDGVETRGTARTTSHGQRGIEVDTSRDVGAYPDRAFVGVHEQRGGDPRRTVRLNPADAADLLANLGHICAWDPDLLEQYVSAITAGDWKPTELDVVIEADRLLHSGCHLLAACAKTGLAIDANVLDYSGVWLQRWA